MAQLNYQVLKESGYDGFVLERAPEKVMQFGEGNFLRAFVDNFIDIANEKAGFNGKVVLVQPIAQGLTELINQQEGLYTLYLRGSEKGEKGMGEKGEGETLVCVPKTGKAEKRKGRSFRHRPYLCRRKRFYNRARSSR